MATVERERLALIPQFDRRAVPAYSVLATMLLTGLVASLLSGFTLSSLVLRGVPTIAVLILSAGLVRKVGWPRLATWLEANAIVYGQSIPSLLILAPGAALMFPIADARLAAADQALGFDWVATVYFLQPYLRPLWIGYNSFSWQPSVAIALLAYFDRDRCWQYVTAGVFCLLATCLIFPFFPAYGAFSYYGIGPNDYPPLDENSSPWTWMAAFNHLRNGYKVVDANVMGSLVSFPSYHAVVGVLSAWAAWPFRYARVPALVLNAHLIVGALIFGTHHLIDLIAGACLAAVAILLVNIRLNP